MSKKTIAIIGAGASGLMVADYLSQFDVDIQVFEQMPSAGRKILMAGKTGLNISHAEPLEQFIQRYTPSDWLEPYIHQYSAPQIRAFMNELGIESYVGSSGRIFPKEMKASPLLRAWLAKLKSAGVEFFYRHRCEHIQGNQATFCHLAFKQETTFSQSFDAIVLACGAVSWAKLGSDGKWQAWLNPDDITPFYASNAGIQRTWSPFLHEYFGQALKRVNAVVHFNHDKIQAHGDIVLSHYGMESGVIYKLNSALRQQKQSTGEMVLTLDLLPDIALDTLKTTLSQKNKQSMSNRLRKLGLDSIKIAVLRECTAKQVWASAEHLAQAIKQLQIPFDDFRPIDEAISCGGGVKQSALSGFQLKSNPAVFCCGEMLDWDAPTGGYLLTACFATGKAVGEQLVKVLDLKEK